MPNLNEFKTNVANDIVSRARFEVTCGNVASISSGLSSTGLTFSGGITIFYCDEAEIPGINLLTKESRTFGPEFKTAYQRAYDPVQLSFILTNDFQTRYFFEAWMDSINDFESGISSYYSDYVTDITISQYGNYAIDDKGNKIGKAGITRGLLGGLTSGVAGITGALPIPGAGIISNAINNLFPDGNYKHPVIYKAILRNAYPTRVDTMPLSWGDTDSYHRQTVNFLYESIDFPKVTVEEGGSGIEHPHLSKKFQR